MTATGLPGSLIVVSTTREHRGVSLLPGPPWTIRLAGAWSARPALELYENGVLLDVVSSTRIAPQLVRGARTAMDHDGSRTLVWGRLPAGARPAVEFKHSRRRSRHVVAMRMTDWCWFAVADGSFNRVVISAGGGRVRLRVSGSRRWH